MRTTAIIGPPNGNSDPQHRSLARGSGHVRPRPGGPAAFESGQLAGLYAPPRTPVIVDVPTIVVLALDIPDDPATSLVAAEAADALLAVSAAVRRVLDPGADPVEQVGHGMPLEVLSPSTDTSAEGSVDRPRWTLLIAQPHGAAPDVVRQAIEIAVAAGAPAIASTVERRRFHEGWAAQLMDVGSPVEVSTVDERLASFIKRHGYRAQGRRHEIRIDDPSMIPLGEVRRIVRQPVIPLS